MSVWWSSIFGSGEITLTRYDLSVVFKVIISKPPSSLLRRLGLLPIAKAFTMPLMRPECEGMQQTK